ncbi:MULTISPECIES: cytochrome P450 [unclassified Pseudofrankia]|uniref:cytochrome P450 n=1 Tax=unclassified Pseudofrankia TaxID=2994372 RepID=UPI0008D9E8C7|nr:MULTISPECIES: cytochrome P450 [unclassified Pseudofrankia]MDT3447026.1 cytochrome P450 [Pseudofrankia sp. BMG5.37]OHV53158.1 cytochrome [Pseudofrankia sp. BMG5.36]
MTAALGAPPSAGPAVITPEQAAVNIFDPAWNHNTFPNYQVLREAGPFVPGPLGMRLVTRYREIDAILQDSAWSHAEEGDLMHPDSDGSDLPTSFLWMEPPDHTRIRKLVSRAFTVRRIEETRARASALVDGLLDAAVAAGEVDLVEAIAYPLPLTMIADLMGVPEADHAAVRSWSSGLARGLDPDLLLTPAEVDNRQRSAKEIRDYLTELVARRRAEPTGDLVSALALAEAEGDRLSNEEMLATLVVLLVAGHETTVALIASTLDALMRYPDQYAALRANPDLAVPAVDELMRFHSPAHISTRRAVRDTEVSGERFAEGDGVIVLLASGNRDPEVYADADRLDLARYAGDQWTPRHLGFGRGHHYCIGAPMVRLEMDLLLRALARRAPRMTPLVDPPPYRPNMIVRGIGELRVRMEEN